MPDDATPSPRVLRLSLNSPRSVRGTLARLARMRVRGELDSLTFRDVVYGISTILAYDKHIADLRTEERLEAIEKALLAKESSDV
jgi:hypothetical protein